MPTNNIIKDYQLRDLIERLENASDALDGLFLFDEPEPNEVRDIAYDAANARDFITVIALADTVRRPEGSA